MEYIKEELKKIIPLSVFVFLLGLSHSIGLGVSLIGFFFLFEHMWSYGRWDFFDILGHETMGILLLVIGFLLMNSIISATISLLFYLAFANYKWEGVNPLPYALEKIKFLWRLIWQRK